MVHLSGSGARLLSPRPMAVGQHLSLRLPALNGAERGDVQGRVVWKREMRKGWQAGIRFTNLGDADRDVIARSGFQDELRWRKT